MAKPITHKSMRGTTINMAEMRQRNEDAVAVTGVGSQVPRMNARGDTFKSLHRIDRKREQIEADYYTQLEGNAKRVDIKAVEADTFESPQAAVERMMRQQEELKAAMGTPQQAPKPVVPRQAPIDTKIETLTDIIADANEDKTPRTRKFVEKED